MYPSTFFGLFPPFPRDERAFVAMSFDERFEARWNAVIAPGIRAVRVNDIPLEPHRVDLRIASDSILTEILEGIGRCRVFLADITSIGEVNGRTLRNANVMYEVGLAHAVRLPEEVILFRSDCKELIFDVANVRVHRYDPDGSAESARLFVRDTILQSLREVDLKKGFAVRKAAESLDLHGLNLLFEATVKHVVHQPPTRTMGEALGGIARSQAIARLLDMGALRAEVVRLTPELLARTHQPPDEEAITYRITALGEAIVLHAADKMGLRSPDLQQSMESLEKRLTERIPPADGKA